MNKRYRNYVLSALIMISSTFVLESAPLTPRSASKPSTLSKVAKGVLSTIFASSLLYLGGMTAALHSGGADLDTAMKHPGRIGWDLQDLYDRLLVDIKGLKTDNTPKIYDEYLFKKIRFFLEKIKSILEKNIDNYRIVYKTTKKAIETIDLVYMLNELDGRPNKSLANPGVWTPLLIYFGRNTDQRLTLSPEEQVRYLAAKHLQQSKKTVLGFELGEQLPDAVELALIPNLADGVDMLVDGSNVSPNTQGGEVLQNLGGVVKAVARAGKTVVQNLGLPTSSYLHDTSINPTDYIARNNFMRDRAHDFLAILRKDLASQCLRLNGHYYLLPLRLLGHLDKFGFLAKLSDDIREVREELEGPALERGDN